MSTVLDRTNSADLGGEELGKDKIHPDEDLLEESVGRGCQSELFERMITPRCVFTQLNVKVA